MITINRQEADNISGILTVSFLDVNDIVFIPPQVDHIITESDIIIRSGASWLYFYGTPESIGFSCQSEEDNAGTTFTPALTLKYPREAAEIVAALEDMARRPMILITEDSNGIRKILGDVKNPMRMMFNPVKPAEAAGYNGYEVTFSGRYTHTPYLLV
jgi:hypothetical protein